MKKFVLGLVLVLASLSSFAGNIEAEKSESFDILTRVMAVHDTSSQASGLDAKVVELLAGDGMNPARIAVVFDGGFENSKVFVLDTMLLSVSRITFSAIDTVTINYLQETYDDVSDLPIKVKKSLQIKVKRNENSELADSAEVIDL